MTLQQGVCRAMGTSRYERLCVTTGRRFVDPDVLRQWCESTILVVRYRLTPPATVRRVAKEDQNGSSLERKNRTVADHLCYKNNPTRLHKDYPKQPRDRAQPARRSAGITKKIVVRDFTWPYARPLSIKVGPTYTMHKRRSCRERTNENHQGEEDGNQCSSHMKRRRGKAPTSHALTNKLCTKTQRDILNPQVSGLMCCRGMYAQ